MEYIKISVLDFTENPGPRYIRQDRIGDSTSGEAFYIEKLNREFAKAFEEKKNACVGIGRSLRVSFFFS